MEPEDIGDSFGTLAVNSTYCLVRDAGVGVGGFYHAFDASGEIS
jgi:hypothetical protein